MSLVELICWTFLSIAVLNLMVRLFLRRRGRDFRIQEYGPGGYPLLGCLLAFNRNKHRLLDWYTEMMSASPGQTIVVARLGARRTVVTANPANVEHILKSRFDNYPKGKAFSDMLGDLLGQGIFNVDDISWRRQRKLLSHEFSARAIKDATEVALAAETYRMLFPALVGAADKGEAVDLQALLRRLAFETICTITMGSSCPDSQRLALSEAFDAAAVICARRGAAPLHAVWKAKRALRIGSEKLLRERMAVVNKVVGEVVKERKRDRERNQGESDFLSRVISAGHTDTMVRDMVVSFIMAGRDTTSSALTWFFWLLSCYPEAESRVADEVTKVEGELTHALLKDMTWLEACLYESMRLYPPVAWDSKHALHDDVLPDGTKVFKGDRVTYFPYGMGRMERLWGKDAMEFRPNRWLDVEEKEIVKVSPYKYPVFQAGPRVCLGKDMAFAQMKYVAASVLRWFRLCPISTAEPVFLPLLTSHMAGGLFVSVHRRVCKTGA